MVSGKRVIILVCAVVLLAAILPVAWCGVGARGFFEGGRCACGYDIFIQISGDGYFDWCPGHGTVRGRIYSLRPREGGFEAVGAGGEVTARLRFENGDLWTAASGSANWARHARVYNVWRIWIPALLTSPATQKITCVNNLKQMGLAFKTWSLDHNDRFPFNVSTNEGGSLEVCSIGSDSFDINAFSHFAVMSNELNSPLILVCPKDRSKKPASSFGKLRPENITYRLRSGPTIDGTNGSQILVVCPIDGNCLYCDGTVKEGKYLKK